MSSLQANFMIDKYRVLTHRQLLRHFKQLSSWKYEKTIQTTHRASVFKLHNVENTVVAKVMINEIRDANGMSILMLETENMKAKSIKYTVSYHHPKYEFDCQRQVAQFGLAPRVHLVDNYKYLILSDNTEYVIDAYAYVMDYIPHGTYMDRLWFLRRSKYEVRLSTLCRMLDHVEIVIETLRKHQIMHHDVAFRNLLFANTADFTPLVIDFGLVSRGWVPEVHVHMLLDDLYLLHQYMPDLSAVMLERIVYLIRKWCDEYGTWAEKEGFMNAVCKGIAEECFSGIGYNLLLEKRWEEILDAMKCERMCSKRTNYVSKLSDAHFRRLERS